MDNYLSGFFGKSTVYEKLLTFVLMTSFSFYGLSISLTDSVKVGVLAVLASSASYMIYDYMEGMGSLSRDFNATSVHDQNQQNMRVIDSDL